MPTPQRAPITITSGSTVLEVLPEQDSWTRRAAEGRPPVGKLVLRDFSRGLGHFSLDAEPGGYLIGTNVDCFPGDTRVALTSELRGVSRRWYEGQFVRITTARGYQLTGTPNHPVLTDRGWVPLHLVAKGDRVISRSRKQHGTPGSPDIHHVNPTLREVFDLAALAGQVERSNGSRVQFHGDGQQGQVEIVHIKGELRNRLEATLFKPNLQHFFAPMPSPKRMLKGNRLITPPLHRMPAVAQCLLHGITHRSPLLGSHFAHTKGHLLFAATRCQAKADDAPANKVAGEIQHFADELYRFTRVVAPDDLIGRNRNSLQFTSLAVSAGGDSCSSQPMAQGSMRPPFILRDGKERFTGQVSLDDVISVDVGSACGHVYNLHTSDEQYIANNIITHNCRWPGVVIPGPREEADLTGIDAGYRVRQRIMHGGVNWVLTDNGTNTKVYRVETGAWAVKLTVNTTIGTCLVSFKDVIAVGLGSAVAYKYSSNDGSSWTDSTKASNSKYMNFATIVQPARDAAKVAYVRNPSDLYFTEDLSNSSESSTSSTVGDANNDEFTGIISDDNASLYMGKRHYLYTIASDGSVWAVDGPRRYVATSEAGAAGKANYAQPVKIEGRLYFPYEDSNILELNPHTGGKHEHMEPAAFGPQVPRLQLPINAMTEVAGWLVVAIGSASTSTIRSGAVAPGGTALLANTFATTSELYFGKYVNLGDEQGERWVWHGSLLTCTDLLGHMWYDDDTDFLYLASSASESANAQQVRCFVPPINPLFKQTSSIVKLNTGTWTLETGLFQAGEANVHVTKTWRTAKVTSRGLASSTPSLAVKYRVADDDGNTAYSTLATYTTPALARTGTSFPASTSGHGVRFQFTGAGNASSNTYTQLYRAEMEFLLYPEALDAMSVTFKAVSGQVLRTGARATTSMKEVRAALDALKDSTSPFTVTENESGDSWECVLMGWEERGSGKERVISMTLVEAP